MGVVVILFFVVGVLWAISHFQKANIIEKAIIVDIGDRERREKEKEGEEEPLTKVYSQAGAAPKNISGQMTECLYTIEGIPSPKGISFSPSGEEIWITSLMNKERGVVIFDVQTGKHKKDVVLPDGGGVEVIFNKEGSFAYVSQMETGRVFEIDALEKDIVRTFNTQSAWTKVMALSPKEDYLYASNWSGNDVSVINLETGKTDDIIPTVETPRGLYVSGKGDYLYVAGFRHGELQKINLNTGESKTLFRSGGAMRHIVGNDKEGVIYLSDMAGAVTYKMDVETEEIEEFAKTENNPNTIKLTPDRRVLVVSSRGVNHPSGNYHIPGPEWGTVLLFDAQSGKLVDVLLGGNQPTGLDIEENGQYLAYSNFLDGEIVVCQLPETEKLLGRDREEVPQYKDKIRK